MNDKLREVVKALLADLDAAWQEQGHPHAHTKAANETRTALSAELERNGNASSPRREEPVAWQWRARDRGDGNPSEWVMCSEHNAKVTLANSDEKHLEVRPLYATTAAKGDGPSAHPEGWQTLVLAKLDRTWQCFDDGEGTDVGRPWIDALTLLGLMERVGRRRWAITEAGEAALSRAGLGPPQCIERAAAAPPSAGVGE